MTATDVAPTVKLPEAARELLRQARGDGDAARWLIGDIAVELCDELDAPKAAVYAAISDDAGVMPATVRRYEETARAWPVAHRPGAFRDWPTLTWYHYATVRSQVERVFMLETAYDSADDYGGNPMPVRVLAAKMNGRNKPTTDWVQKFYALVKELYKWSDDYTNGIRSNEARVLLVTAFNALAEAAEAERRATP